jgi:hypothetical protein
MSKKYLYGYKALLVDATYPNGINRAPFYYNLPRRDERWSDWTEAPDQPAEPDGRDCGAGGLHIHNRPTLAYAEIGSVLWLARYLPEDVLGKSDSKTRVRKLQLSRITRLMLHSMIRCGKLRGADLVGANLTGVTLRGADLTGADLTKADLTGAYLYGSTLIDAYLTGADLNGADLRGANLTGSTLYDANLVGAYLGDANLNGADLRGANLTGASLREADLRSADLREAILPDGTKFNNNTDLSKFTNR